MVQHLYTHYLSHAPQSPRNRTVDLLRTAALLYIVGFWHLFEYAPALNGHKDSVTGLITKLCLGLFIFISGYLLAQRYQFSDRPQTLLAESLSFYRKRLLRIYPLYFLALSLFWACQLIDATTYGRALFFTTLLPYRPLTTLWFISVIMVCYGLTPLYLHRYSWAKTVGLTFAIVAGLWVIVLTTDAVDLRLPLYLPAFAYGLIVGKHPGVAKSFRRSPTAVLALMVTALNGALSLSLPAGLAQFVVVDLTLFGAIPLAWFGCHGLAQRLPAWGESLLNGVSYASFSAYLIHRVTYHWARQLYQPVEFTSALLYWLGIALPCTLLIAFVIQWLYDRLLRAVG